jgi:O-acetyl-ADP-ribose deacetylase (regulator of RNase III)
MITYLKGDATDPQAIGNKAIVHICNDGGGWGAGFVLSLSKRWKSPEALYRQWFHDKTTCNFGRFELGNVAYTQVKFDTYVFNMIAQCGYGKFGNLQHKSQNDSSIPLQYDALELCLEKVANEVRQLNATIHAPRIGCGLAGGDWNKSRSNNQ